jgi:GcrA cell cycle regulator
MAWENEKVALLLELNKQDFSASQIAEKLGEGVTRNAVIGKLNRMGLSCGGGKHSSSTARSVRKKPETLNPSRKSRPVLSAVPELNPSKENIGIADLSDATCRFPMGDPKEVNFRFCGAEKGYDALPYCDYHTQLAHQRSNRAILKAEKGKAQQKLETQVQGQGQGKRRAAG